MDYRAIFQISAAGMNLEKLRLDTAALNLANIDTSTAPGAIPFKPLRVVGQAVVPSFDRWMQIQGAGDAQAAVVPMVVETEAQPRIVRDPAHPHADTRGDVRYPGVNHTAEMLTIMTALRAYEANIAAIGAAKSMASRALEIGGR